MYKEEWQVTHTGTNINILERSEMFFTEKRLNRNNKLVMATFWGPILRNTLVFW